MNPKNKSPKVSNVTQKMVAARAGVSQGTVSHILGGLGERYNKQTREEVQQAAQELGYHHNRAAQAMRRGRSNTIAHLNFGGYSELAGRKSFHLGRFVHEAGFDYQVIDSYWWPEEGAKVTSRILLLRPEGLIVSGSLQTDIDFRNVESAGIPIVSTEAEVAGVSRVHHDVRGAIKELTLACLAQGRCPALLLRENPVDALRQYWTIASRRKGFLEALREHGYDNVPEIVAGEPGAAEAGDGPMIIWNAQKTTPSAHFEPGEHVGRWLLGAGRLPDALICTNDFYAIGVMGVLQQAGIRIPEDVAITGFDNLSYSMQRAIGLTTVEQPLEAMCREAVDLLKRQINPAGPPSRKKTVTKVLPCRIHWRRSLPQKGASAGSEDTGASPNGSEGSRMAHASALNCRASAKSAVSLIEMLVAIAILAVLAVLTLPVINKMRDRAHVAGCLNNLRQIGMGIQLYASDNDGLLPQSEAQKPGEPGTKVWPYRIAPYIGVQDFAKTYQDATLAKRSPFTCPAETDYSTQGQPWVHYSLNRHLNERLYGASSRIRQAAVRSPSKWMLVADSFKSWNLLTDSAQKMKAAGITRRHDGIPNFLYADGHVAPFVREIIGEGDPGGQDPFYRALWTHDYAP